LSLLAATFCLGNDAADALGDILLEHGAQSVNIEDAHEGSVQEQALFGEPGSAPAIWRSCRMTVIFPPVPDIQAILQHAFAAAQLALPQFDISRIEDVDWVRRSQEQFQPIRISDLLYIVPTWHSQSFRTPANAISLLLDPGAAFGTGSHPTTRLCLCWLEKTLPSMKDCSVLDYGCGSGILAIAALRLGARQATGVDIDPLAIEAACHNAAQNQVSADFISSDEQLEMRADITVANILSGPLVVLAPLLAAHTRAGGRLALSGVLSSQASEVIEAYLPWFDMAQDSQEEDWVCLAGTRRSE
jgi:ribosomal protein L11 methyltransferase